jgi:hypothetical protein
VRHRKSRIELGRLVALIIVVVVALSATTSTAVANGVPGLGRALAGLSAFGSALLPTFRSSWSGTKPKNWTRARSVSEALKGDVYL